MIRSATSPNRTALSVMLLATVLGMGACTQKLAIERVFEDRGRAIFAFDPQFEGPAFGFVQGAAKQYCLSINLALEPYLLGQVYTLNGIGYAEFQCAGQNISGLQPRTLPELSQAETERLLAEQGEALPEPELLPPLR
ncbi:MAG: hypothetical protein AAF556_04045 [Pseudomonadota bacterium]